MEDIKMLIIDVDGVLTDGRIIVNDRGEETKNFHVRDGSAISFWHRAGLKTAIISGRKSKSVEHRAKELNIKDIYQDAKNKLEVYEKILKKHDLKDKEVCYIGDDLIDIPIMRRVGLPVAVQDASPEVKEHSRYVTTARGGNGAVREVVEKILKYQGKWDKIIERYF